MKAFDNWEKVTPMMDGEGNKLPAGGYICRIKSAEETTSKSGKKMLEVRFDIAEGQYAGYYMEKYKKAKPKNDSESVRWQGTHYIVLEGEYADARFKGFISALEESNPNFQWNWDENSLSNLLFGGIFGEEEFKGDRGIGKTTKLRYVRNVECIRTGDYQIPEPKLYEEPVGPFTNFNSNDTEDSLPF